MRLLGFLCQENYRGGVYSRLCCVHHAIRFSLAAPSFIALVNGLSLKLRAPPRECGKRSQNCNFDASILLRFLPFFGNDRLAVVSSSSWAMERGAVFAPMGCIGPRIGEP